VGRAVESAKRGFARWRRTPAPARGDVLRVVGDIMTRRKDEIADLMTREMGKPLTETRGDVQEGIDTAYYAASEGRRLFGHTVPSEMRNKWAMSYRRPIGVCGIVTPVNFPMAIPTWKMFPALLCGNAWIFKPAEAVPHTGADLVDILLQSILQRGIHDRFLGQLVDRVRSLKLGDGRKKGTDVGPLVNENAREKVERYIDIGQSEGADLLCGGRRPPGKEYDKGFFFEPTIFA